MSSSRAKNWGGEGGEGEGEGGRGRRGGRGRIEMGIYR